MVVRPDYWVNVYVRNGLTYVGGWHSKMTSRYLLNTLSRDDFRYRVRINLK